MSVIAMVLEARNRFRIWYIDKNQNIYPGTRHIKLNVGERLPTINIDISVDGVRHRWPEMKIMSPTRGAIATGNNFTIERPR
jgi:hypothetical protein